MKNRDFLKKLGLLAINKKKHASFYFFIILISMIPLLLAAGYLFMKNSDLNALSLEVNSLINLSNKTQKNREYINNIAKRYQKQDTASLSTDLTNLILKKKEFDSVSTALKWDIFSNNQPLKTRSNFLKENNKLNFSVKNIGQNNDITEQLYKLKNEVEIDSIDLENILSILEDRKNIATQNFQPSLNLLINIKVNKTSENTLKLQKLNFIKRNFNKERNNEKK